MSPDNKRSRHAPTVTRLFAGAHREDWETSISLAVWKKAAGQATTRQIKGGTPAIRGPMLISWLDPGRGWRGIALSEESNLPILLMGDIDAPGIYCGQISDNALVSAMAFIDAAGGAS